MGRQTAYLPRMSRPTLVPDPPPKTLLERFAEMAERECARADTLARRVTELEGEAHPRLAEIADLKVELREVKGAYLLLRAAARNVLSAHEQGDDALTDEALARMEEVFGASTP